MRGLTSVRTLAMLAITALAALATAQGAAAQSAAAGPVGLGDQLFSTGGDITIEVRPATAALVSELRLFAPDGSFTSIATNKQVGKIVTLPARPKNEELVFGIFIASQSNTTFKMGPADRNPDGLAHAVVHKTGERQYDVGFEDLRNGGDRDYDDNTFRFSGGLAPNRSPVAADQSLTVPQGGSLPLTLSATDDDGDALAYAISGAPLHGVLTGKGTTFTYTPAADFSGTDTFGFTADDGQSTPAEGRITISVTPVAAAPTAPTTPTTGSGRLSFGDCPVGELTLVNVRRAGHRVLLSGLAEPTLAGAPVTIVEGGLSVIRTTIQSDGSFRTSVPVPSQRGGRILRYQAKLGLLHSRTIRLRRRMITTSAGLRGARIVLRGRVTNVRRLRRAPVVDLYARPRGCAKQYVRVGRARLRRNGAFTVSAPPLQGVGVAVYRATTRLPGGRTFTLPQTIAGR